MWCDELCEILVSSSENTTSSSAFQASKKLMFRVLSEQGQTVDEIPVRIKCYCEEIDVQLLEISQLISRQHELCEQAWRVSDESGASQPLYYGLRFRVVDISIVQEHTDATLLEYAAEIASYGVQIDCLRPAFTGVQQKTPHAFMNAMVQLFPLVEQGETQDVGGVACVSVRGFSPLKAYPAIFSAVAVSSCVRKIEFFPDSAVDEVQILPKHQWLWSWLAYSAFLRPRNGINQPIQEIWIQARTLDENAVDEMTRILQSFNPVAALFNRGRSDTAPETVAASRFALLDPSSRSGRRLPKWSCGQRFDNLPVIERKSNWVSVLLPRWGQAWVHRDDVLRSQSSVSTAPEIQSIYHVVVLNVRVESVGPLVALLRFVGKGIRDLNVSSVRFPQASTNVDWEYVCLEILKACPVLESLEVHGNSIQLATLDCILDAFASGLCRLQRLKLDSDYLVVRNRSLKPLVDALSNRHHPASRNLREITLGYLPFGPLREKSVVPSCVAMLKENVVLQQLCMRFRIQNQHRAQFSACVAQLQPFDDERIDGRRDPRAILAFLSVVTAD